MLAAKARGLDTCAQIFLTKYHSVVRRHLPIDDSQIIACGMSIGYADTNSIEYAINIPRIPVNEFASIVGLERHATSSRGTHRTDGGLRHLTTFLECPLSGRWVERTFGRRRIDERADDLAAMIE